MRTQSGFTLPALLLVLLMLAGMAGYILNIVKVLGMTFATITAELVVRIIGIILPFAGAVAGYF